MFVGIANTPRDYAWGSRDDIAQLLGRKPSGGPEAEYWLGTHPGSPSRLETGGTLSDLTTLPFLLKVLAADAPLSLQAHPNLEQARAGFDRESALGIPLDSPTRNYKDALHKPELVYALSDEYHALCGFRSVAATRELLATLGPDPLVAGLLDRLVDDSSLRSVFEWLITRGDGVDELVARVVELAASATVSSQAPLEFVTVGDLAAAYPGDPGIVIALLLNRVALRRGQVLYLPAGNIHAYLKGLGIELMAASDNVLRGGLTPKYVDVPELVGVLDFRPLPVPILEPIRPSAGIEIFRPDVPDFELVVVEPGGGSAVFTPTADSIALCSAGELSVSGASGSRSIPRGASVYVTADEGELTFAGTGTIFLATSELTGPR
ncbi:MAG: mannose-6-phosphate isomerase [Actinomycetota bacterium]|nr:mannose-6-phosphate isomerase [Actinomycetota bacterium]